MKRIIYLGGNKFVHLDSYNASNETRIVNVLSTLFVIAIAAMTAGAMLGVDITQFNSQQTQHETR